VDDAAFLSQLESLAESLGIGIRYEPLEGEGSFFAGGLCRIRNRSVFIINAGSNTKVKVHVLARALRRFDLSRIYLRPALRELLEGCHEEKESHHSLI
jgi:hypothetical protein